MTNKEYLLTLSDRECAEKIEWLWTNYSTCYTDSLLAIQEWLGEEHMEKEEPIMNKEEKIKLLKTMKDLTHENSFYVVGNNYYDSNDIKEVLNDSIEAMSIHKTGYWVKMGGSFRCSECMAMPEFTVIKKLKYCPNCGAKMTIK